MRTIEIQDAKEGQKIDWEGERFTISSLKESRGSVWMLELTDDEGAVETLRLMTGDYVRVEES